MAISGNGNRTLPVAGDQLLFFNTTNDVRRTITLPNKGLEVFLSDDGLSGAVSMSDGTARFMQFSNQVVPNNYNWDHDFGTGYPDVFISREGSTALVMTVEGISVYDIGLSSVRWTKDTDYAFVLTSDDLSGDGSIVAIPCYGAGQLRIYDGWTGALIQSTEVYDPSFVKVSADGETVAVLAYTIIVFRPSLALIAGSEAWTDDPQNTMVQIEDVKDDLNETQAELQTANDKIDSLQTMQFVALGVMIALGLVIIVLLLRRRPN